MSANEHLTAQQLSAFFDRELESAEQARVSGHLDACSSCRSRLEEVSALSSAIGTETIPEPPAGLQEKIRSSIRHASSTATRTKTGKSWLTRATPYAAAATVVLGMLAVVLLRDPAVLESNQPNVTLDSAPMTSESDATDDNELREALESLGYVDAQPQQAEGSDEKFSNAPIVVEEKAQPSFKAEKKDAIAPGRSEGLSSRANDTLAKRKIREDSPAKSATPAAAEPVPDMESEAVLRESFSRTDPSPSLADATRDQDVASNENAAQKKQAAGDANAPHDKNAPAGIRQRVASPPAERAEALIGSADDQQPRAGYRQKAAQESSARRAPTANFADSTTGAAAPPICPSVTHFWREVPAAWQTDTQDQARAQITALATKLGGRAFTDAVPFSLTVAREQWTPLRDELRRAPLINLNGVRDLPSAAPETVCVTLWFTPPAAP